MIRGKVLVNKGKGYISSGSVEPGDQILVGSKSEAVLMFPDGCDVTIKANQVYRVPDAPPCQQQVRQIESPGDVYGSVAQPSLPPSEPVFDNTMLLGAGVLGAAGIGAGIYFLTRKSASP